MELAVDQKYRGKRCVVNIRELLTFGCFQPDDFRGHEVIGLDPVEYFLGVITQWTVLLGQQREGHPDVSVSFGGHRQILRSGDDDAQRIHHSASSGHEGWVMTVPSHRDHLHGGPIGHQRRHVPRIADLVITAPTTAAITIIDHGTRLTRAR